MLKCVTCKCYYHDECVGLKSLSKFLKLSEDGLLGLDDWICPECIVTARLLRPDSPLFDAIATKAARILAEQSKVHNTSQLDSTVNAWENSSIPVTSATSFGSIINNDNFPPLPSSNSSSSLQSSSKTPTHATKSLQSQSGFPNTTPAGVAARKVLPPQPRLTIHCDDVQKTRTAIDKALENIPISQARNFSS